MMTDWQRARDIDARIAEVMARREQLLVAVFDVFSAVA
jgi:hypothetical protein